MMYDPGTLPDFSVKTFLSIEINWDTFATESLANPVNLYLSTTFPGAVARFRLLVSFHPQMVFLPNLSVNLRVCLCGVVNYASAQVLDFLDLGQK
ncbi:MAG: hypothetical protein PVG26_19925, partial [Desulfobacterales bacterium]